MATQSAARSRATKPVSIAGVSITASVRDEEHEKGSRMFGPAIEKHSLD